MSMHVCVGMTSVTSLNINDRWKKKHNRNTLLSGRIYVAYKFDELGKKENVVASVL